MTNGSTTMEQKSARHILRSRARALARPFRAAAAKGATLEVLEFRLAHERYAIENRWVTGVSAFRELTPLPCCPSFVLGIVNVRGRILPVLDIKRFFDLPQKGLTDLHRIVLVAGDGLEFGILADTVTGVRSIAVDELQPPLPTHDGVSADYLKGVTAERLVVLEMARILADPKIIVHQEV